MMRYIDQLQRYVRYAFDHRGFDTRRAPVQISPDACAVASVIRGPQNPPALMIHGIMKRAGTVYSGHLLKLHPAIGGYARELWETPLLARAGDMQRLQAQFLQDYRPNIDRMSQDDLLPVFGAAFIAYLYAALPPEQRALTKTPSVEYLDRFFALFPHEHLLVVVRDGRDVVQSTVATWEGLPFRDACRRWAASARMVLACDRHFGERQGYLLARFEDVVAEPDQFVTRACTAFGLDPARYPWEEIAHIPLQGSSTVKRDDGRAKYWVRKPRDFNPVGRWQQWQPRHKRMFKRIAGQELMALGYADNLDW